MFSEVKHAKVFPIIEGATSESKENNENTNSTSRSPPKKLTVTIPAAVELPFGWGDGEPPTPE